MHATKMRKRLRPAFNLVAAFKSVEVRQAKIANAQKPSGHMAKQHEASNQADSENRNQ